MYEQVYKRIDDALWKDAGCGSELDYVEQSSWILFLRYLDDLERSREEEAKLDGREYIPIIEKRYRWSSWAVPKNKAGDKDESRAVNVSGLDPETLDLTVRNPNTKDEKVYRAPSEIAAEMTALERANSALLAEIMEALS